RANALRAYADLATETDVDLSVSSFHCLPAAILISTCTALPAELQQYRQPAGAQSSPDLPKVWMKFATTIQPDPTIDLDEPINDQHPDLTTRAVLREFFLS